MKASKAKQGRASPKAKSLEEYRQEKPGQLTFFEYLLPEDRRYSNTIEFYDFIPKYSWGKSQRVDGPYLKTLKREFECRGIRCKVEIDPARIKDRNGQEKEYYPGLREELVEDALRKFASEGQGLFLDAAAGVTFTLHQLQQELKSKGHSYSKDQIKDALLICAKAKMTINSEDGSVSIVSSLFETIGLNSRDDWQNDGRNTKAFVRFHPLVTRGIKTGGFRQLNYEKAMTYRSVIARQLHKRMSHHYTQASITNTYHLMLSTMIRDFGLTAYAQLRDNLRDVLAAIEELKEKEVLLDYKVEKVFDPKRRNKLIDAKLDMIPHPRFISEAVQANKRQAEFPKQLS
jgi:hypothetical protein